MKLDLPRPTDFDAGVWYSTPASSRYPTHWHDEFELNLVLWGRVQYEVGSSALELGPGSLLWLPPGQQHTLLDVSEDLAMWVASFRPRAVHAAGKLAGTRWLERHRACRAPALPPERVRELSALHAELASCEDPLEVNACARQLLGSLVAQRGLLGEPLPDGASTARPLHPAVVRARTLLRVPESALSLTSLARRCGLDAARLSRLFKQQMGLSVVQFRNHFRVQHFIQQFGQGERATMIDVALGCGFGSYAQFHRAFHQVTGYAPSEHLRRVRAGIVVPVPQGLELPPE